jgi:hypothetical protein
MKWWRHVSHQPGRQETVIILGGAFNHVMGILSDLLVIVLILIIVLLAITLVIRLLPLLILVVLVLLVVWILFFRNRPRRPVAY